MPPTNPWGKKPPQRITPSSGFPDFKSNKSSDVPPQIQLPKSQYEEIQEECWETRDVALVTLQAEVNGVKLLTLGGVQEEATRDEEMSGVARAIETGVWPQELGAYRRAKLSLCVVDSVVMYGDRLVIPRSLYGRVLAEAY